MTGSFRMSVSGMDGRVEKLLGGRVTRVERRVLP